MPGPRKLWFMRDREIDDLSAKMAAETTSAA